MNCLLSKDIILFCGLSSSGKSSVANLLCEFDPSFAKINTKKMNVISEQIISRQYFQQELETAAELVGKPFAIINDIFLEAKKLDSLLPLVKVIGTKLSQLDPRIYLGILYQNYAVELKDIIAQDQKCIIDHNIFSDPHPLRKDIFLEQLASDNFMIINIYSNFENIILNTLERNQRFYNFINNGSSKADLDDADIKHGFSNIVFRQPLRIIENLASMYHLSSVDNGRTIQKITGNIFNKILEIAHYEQEKLIGFLIYRNYAFTHIEDSELVQLRSDFAYLTRFNENDLCIQDKRFFYDLQLITDENLSQDKLSSCLKSFSNKIMDLRNKDSSELLIHKINILWEKCRYNKALSVEDFTTKIHCDSYQTYIINNFVDHSALDELVNHLIIHPGKRIVVYPIAYDIFCKIILNNQDPSRIKIHITNPFLAKDFKEFDNNLIFLARLYSRLKIESQAYNLRFEFY